MKEENVSQDSKKPESSLFFIGGLILFTLFFFWVKLIGPRGNSDFWMFWYLLRVLVGFVPDVGVVCLVFGLLARKYKLPQVNTKRLIIFGAVCLGLGILWHIFVAIAFSEIFSNGIK